MKPVLPAVSLLLTIAAPARRGRKAAGLLRRAELADQEVHSG